MLYCTGFLISQNIFKEDAKWFLSTSFTVWRYVSLAFSTFNEYFMVYITPIYHEKAGTIMQVYLDRKLLRVNIRF